MSGFIKFVLLVVMLVIATVFRGCILSTLWSWFAVPYGLAAISIPMAIGFYCIFQMFQLMKRPKEDSEISIDSILFPFLWGGMVLLIGYCAKMFM